MVDNDYASCLKRALDALQDNAETIGVPEDSITYNNDFGLNAPAPFIYVFGEFDSVIDESAAIARMKVILRIGAASESAAITAMNKVMEYIQKVCPVMIEADFELSNIEEVFTKADKCIFDVEFLTHFGVY